MSENMSQAQNTDTEQIIKEKYMYVKFKRTDEKKVEILVKGDDGSIQVLKPDHTLAVSHYTEYEYYWVSTLAKANVVAMVRYDESPALHACEVLVERKLSKEEKEKVLETILSEHFCESILRHAREVEFTEEFWRKLAEQSMDP